MKILMLTPYLPYPLLSGGQIRTYNLLKKLANKHDVTLFSLIKNEEEKKYIPELKKYCEKVRVFKRSEKPFTLNNIFKTAFSTYPFLVMRNHAPQIITAVEEGRRIMDNIRKIITFLLTGGFTEIMLIGLSIIFGLPLPILPGQILWKNMIESTPPSMALTFEPKEKEIMDRSPEDPQLPLLTKEMNAMIFVVGILTNFILFGIFVWFWRHNYPLDLIRSMMFVGLAIDSFFFIFSCRNLRKNIWNYNPFANIYVNFTVLFGFLILFVALYLPIFQKLLKTVPLGFFEWSILIIFGLLNLILIEVAKWYFIAKSKINLPASATRHNFEDVGGLQAGN